MRATLNDRMITFELGGYRISSRKLGGKPIKSEDIIDEKIKAVVSFSNGKKTFKVINGVTGFESWYLTDDLLKSGDFSDFCVCAGTKNKYDALYIHHHEWLELVDNYLKHCSNGIAK